MIATQLPLIHANYNNQSLFSDHYLDDILRGDEVWRHAIPQAQEFLAWLRDLYADEKAQLADYNENQLEDKWFKPIFERLGHTWEGQATIPAWKGGVKKPDFVFFPDEEARKTAVSLQNSADYANAALAIGEVKQWGIALDKNQQGAAIFDNKNPMYQIDSYLSLTGLEWGVLSDGRYWRLLHKSSSRTLETYLEIDLLAALEALDEKKATAIAIYFWLFFNQASFKLDANGRYFLNQALDQSRAYALALEADLRDNAYRALEQLILGFFAANPSLNADDPTHLADVYRNSLYLLYRLLFLFYGESRALLPMDNAVYSKKYSLRRLSKEIDRERNDLDSLPATGRRYWGNLRELFRLISGVDVQLNADLGVPRYNGGLFDPQQHPFLEKHRIGDRYVARAIDYLAIRRVMDSGGKPAFHAVDYGTLDVRQLGSIYEGLLEYKVAVAREEMVTVSKKGVETWVPLAQKGKAKTFGNRRQIGELYLTTDKGERKATGSYYTPDYIVEYIVENTLSPLVEQAEARAMGDGDRFIAEILRLNVLDPAMGSGHFLVEATNYLARILSTNTNSGSDLLYWKRRVVEACIYGVDKNPMAVELAKLSLWLKTAAADKPLSFLDHHLQHGDSLIGATMDDLASAPKPARSATGGRMKTSQVSDGQQPLIDESAFTRDVGLAVGGVTAIEEMLTETIEDIHAKEKIWTELQRTHIGDWRRLADVWVSAFFGNNMSREEYRALADRLQGRDSLMSDAQAERLLNHPAVTDNDYFHWQFMFPEVFFDGYGRPLKETAGFDAVIGNPPYGDILSQYEKTFLVGSGYKAGGSGNNDIFRFFVERGLMILSIENPLGFIIPNTCLGGKKYSNYRNLVSARSRIIEILDFKTFKVFEEDVFTHILLLSAYMPGKEYTTMYKASVDGSLTDFKQTSLKIHPESDDTWLPTGKLLDKLRKNPEMLFLSKICNSADVGINYQRHNVGWQNREKSKIAERVFYEGTRQSQYDYLYLKGVDITRFSVDAQTNRWLRHNYAELLEAGETVSVNHDWANKPVKILTRQTGDTIVAAIDTRKHYTGRSLHSIDIIETNYSPYSIIAILNSDLIDYIYAMLSHEKGRALAQVKLKNVRNILIPNINFTTPEPQRTAVSTQSQTLYQQADHPALLTLVTAELAAGRNDTSHDLLAFLAEEMIRLNKEKQTEVNSFLDWLADYTERPLNDWQLKTIARAYYEKGWEEFRRALKRNKNKIKAVDVNGRLPLNKIKGEYEASMSKLTPLLAAIQATDRLIDQIVYQLYGLTDEEIAIVEG